MIDWNVVPGSTNMLKHVVNYSHHLHRDTCINHALMPDSHSSVLDKTKHDFSTTHWTFHFPKRTRSNM